MSLNSLILYTMCYNLLSHRKSCGKFQFCCYKICTQQRGAARSQTAWALINPGYVLPSKSLLSEPVSSQMTCVAANFRRWWWGLQELIMYIKYKEYHLVQNNNKLIISIIIWKNKSQSTLKQNHIILGLNFVSDSTLCIYQPTLPLRVTFLIFL